MHKACYLFMKNGFSGENMLSFSEINSEDIFGRQEPKMKKRIKIVLIILLILIVLIALVIFFTGFFVYQPILDMEQGGIVWFWRIGIEMDFISSTDGILLKEGQSVSFISRPITFIKTLELIEDRLIVTLPYSDFLFEFITNRYK